MAKLKKSNRFDGCTFALVVGLIMTALFVANGVLVRGFLVPSDGPLDSRLVQPLQFGLPIVMIFAEYWLFDRIMRRFSTNRGSG
jgi:hypothetical protein